MQLPSFYVKYSNHQVEAWSTQRLPFEPKGWLIEFRQQLRIALRQLHAHPQQMLHAVYASPVILPCDTENILFYNVGDGSFAAPTRYGLRFERAFQIPVPCPVPLADQPLHYHQYALAPINAGFQYWRKGDILAQWSFVCHAAAIKRCASVWYAMKMGQTSAASERTLPNRYGVRLHLTGPAGSPVQLAKIIKPLFDGIISALHYHDGTDEAEVNQRVAAQLTIPTQEATALLRSRTATVLGQRRLLHRWGQSIQWNPQDDACLVGELLLEQSRATPMWSVRGELFTLVA